MTSLLQKLDRKTLRVSCGCWLWLGSCNEDGYGRLTVGGRKNPKAVGAHRIAYEIVKGKIGTLQVLHTCDVPCCVNPSHLFLGTHDDNMRDAANKGRLKDRNRIAKNKIEFIQANPQLSQRVVAKKLGIGVGTVCRYRNAS